MIFLYCFLQVDIWFYVVLSAIYIVIIAVICCSYSVQDYAFSANLVS